MGLYSEQSFDLLCEQVNRDNPELEVPFSRDSVVLLQGPLTNNLGSSQRNTRTIFNGIQGSGIIGKREVFYDRRDLAKLYGPAKIVASAPATAIVVKDMLGSLNDQLGLALTVNDIANPDAPLRQGAVQGSFTLTINTKSVAYTNVTWQQLYAAGLIYGDDTTGDFITGMTPPNPLRKQDARVTRDGFDFHVRIPKVVDHKKTYQAYASYEGTEIADLFDLLYSDIGVDYPEGKERLYYEAPGKMNFMTSGFYNTSYVNVVNTHKGTTYAALSTPYTWRPVLELIL